MTEQENKIYVGNIEFSVTEDSLKTFVETKGIQVKQINIIKDKYSGRSKGFGFVELSSQDDVQKAISALNGQDFNGRSLKVSEARKPSADRSEGERSSQRW